MKLIEKEDKNKRYIKNWRPNSLMNVNYKMISKDFAPRLKKILPNLILLLQTIYVEINLLVITDIH